MPLTFEVLDAESGVFAYSGDLYDGPVSELHDLLDEYESGELGEKRYLAALDRLLAQTPDLIDVYASKASHWHEQGKPKKALDAALLGLGVCNRLIPEGFNGRIEWGHLDNRPYLRIMDAALLSYMQLRRHKDAVKLIDLMLARNPNDNQGVRYLLGSEALRAGDHDRARAVFEQGAYCYPPYFYELALCHMLRDDWVAAATALRRGFAANPYIGEFFAGNPDPAPLAIWHGTNFAEPEMVHEYMRMYGTLWLRPKQAPAFVRWLFNHSEVLAERAAIMECQEALLWERDAAVRSELLDKSDRLRAGIDDALSVSIVTKRKDRDGQTVWPWPQE
jgi:tetratricopeptide (TPR) repeat protein